MPKLSAKDIAGFAVGAGFPASAIADAVAVAFAESSGITDRRGDVGIQNSTWGPSIGLWQIRSLKAEKGKGTTRDETHLSEPAFNAKSAHAIWAAAGGSFNKDWSAYRSRAYLLYLPAAKIGAAQNGTRALTAASVPTTNNPLIPDSIEGPANALGDLAQFPAKVTAWLTDRNNIVRIAKVMLGGGLVLIGLAVVTRPIQKGVKDTALAVAGVASKAKGAGKAGPKAAPKPAPTAAA